MINLFYQQHPLPSSKLVCLKFLNLFLCWLIGASLCVHSTGEKQSLLGIHLTTRIKSPNSSKVYNQSNVKRIHQCLLNQTRLFATLLILEKCRFLKVKIESLTDSVDINLNRQYKKYTFLPWMPGQHHCHNEQTLHTQTSPHADVQELLPVWKHQPEGNLFSPTQTGILQP